MSATRRFPAALAIILFLNGCAASSDMHAERGRSYSHSGVNNSVATSPLVASHRHDEKHELQAEGATPNEHSDSRSSLQLNSSWQLGEPDLIVKLRAPYSLPARKFRRISQFRYT